MDLAKKADQEIVKGLAAMTVTCPYTGVVLDKRKAVVVSANGRDIACDGEYWDKVKTKVIEGADKAGKKVTVLDGRELFKR